MLLYIFCVHLQQHCIWRFYFLCKCYYIILLYICFCSIVRVLQGRENSGPLSRREAIPTKFYSKMQQHRHTLGHLSAVYCVLFDRTGKYIITGADDLLVKVWSSIDGRLLATFRGASSEIMDIAVNFDNTLLAAGSIDRVLRVWCFQTMSPVSTLKTKIEIIIFLCVQ